MCLLYGWIRYKTVNKCKQMNGLAYFWRAKHKQQIVFYLYFYVPWSETSIDMSLSRHLNRNK